MTKSGTTSSPVPGVGDIVLLPLPFSDQSGAKQRPVLVVAAGDAQGDFIAVPVTSQPGHAHAIDLNTADLSEGKMPKPSWIKADKPYTLHRSLILKRFGAVGHDILGQVRIRLAQRLGIGAAGSKP